MSKEEQIQAFSIKMRANFWIVVFYFYIAQSLVTQVNPTGSNKQVWDAEADSTCTLLVSSSEGMNSKRKN